jgi:putative tryptophan/tyrosine transport system substrate-binding protein
MAINIARRKFIAAVGGAAFAWPQGARAQQADRMRRVGMLETRAADDPEEQTRRAVFMQGLQKFGWVDGHNVRIDYRLAAADVDRSRKYAAELVALAPDVIVASGSANVAALLQTTRTVPIVFLNVTDPVGAGYVARLARPGGNITGVTVDVGKEQWGKRVQMLQQVAQATRFGILQTRETQEQWMSFQRELERGMGIIVVGPPLNYPIDEAEYRRVFAALVQDRAEGVVVSAEDVNVFNVTLIVELTAKSWLPAVYPVKEFVQSGGLMSYGIDQAHLGRRLANVAGQILKGTKPGDIPIMQPTKFELVINLRTAKALGLTVPPELLATADEVIE